MYGVLTCAPDTRAHLLPACFRACLHSSAGDAMEVSCSWRGDGGAPAVAAAFLLRDDAAQLDAAPPPLDTLLTLQPSAAGGPCEFTVVLPRAMALRRVAVHSNARTVELFTSASGSAQTWQYLSSERGAPDGADGFRVEYAAAELDCVCDALKLRLLSLRPPGTLSLRGVVLDAVPATVAPPAAPMAALMSAMQAGGAAQPGSAAALMGMLGALAGAARPASAQPAELAQAQRSAAAAPEVAAATARVHALEVAVGEAAEETGPQAEPLAALELRITRLEARVERGLADFAERLLRLEQGQAAAEHPP